jgi:hypothetical protein
VNCESIPRIAAADPGGWNGVTKPHIPPYTQPLSTWKIESDATDETDEFIILWLRVYDITVYYLKFVMDIV